MSHSSLTSEKIHLSTVDGNRKEIKLKDNADPIAYFFIKAKIADELNKKLPIKGVK